MGGGGGGGFVLDALKSESISLKPILLPIGFYLCIFTPFSWYLTIFQFIYQFVFIGLEQADGAFNWEENWWWRGMLVEQEISQLIFDTLYSA